MASATLVVNDRQVALASQDVERIVTGLQAYADGSSRLGGAARVLMTRMLNPARVGLLLQAVDVQAAEHLLLLDVLAQLEPRNDRLVRLERALRRAVIAADERGEAVSAGRGPTRRWRLSSQRA